MRMSKNFLFIVLLFVFGITTNAYSLSRNFFEVVKNGTIDELKSEIKNNKNIDQQDINGLTPFLFAVGINNLDKVILLRENGASIEKKTNDGKNALMLAVGSGNIDLMQYLLKEGIDINDEDKSGNTALHYAVMAANAQSVSFLINNGAEINKKGGFMGRTPLDLAVRTSCWECAIPLLEAGANPNILDRIGESSLDSCMKLAPKRQKCELIKKYGGLPGK